MSKAKKLDINEMILKAHKLGVKRAIELAVITNTELVEDNNIKRLCASRGKHAGEICDGISQTSDN